MVYSCSQTFLQKSLFLNVKKQNFGKHIETGL